MSSASYARIRKKILDGGNDCIREIEDYIEKLDITIKNKHDKEEE
jgi:hypothetical protein